MSNDCDFVTIHSHRSIQSDTCAVDVIEFSINSYNYNMGDIEIPFNSRADYNQSEFTTAVLGTTDDEDTTDWFIMPVSVNDNIVKITFIDDLFHFINEKNLTLIILNIYGGQYEVLF